MSGIIGSKFNHRGSGLVGSLGTDGQHMLSSGAGKTNVFETVAVPAAYDDEPIKSDLTALAIREATNESSAAFNLPGSFIETFTDDTNLGTQTDGDRTSGYWATQTMGTPLKWTYDDDQWLEDNITVFGTTPGDQHATHPPWHMPNSLYAGESGNADTPLDWSAASIYWPSPSTSYATGFYLDYGASYTWEKLEISKSNYYGNVRQFRFSYSTDESAWTVLNLTGATLEVIADMTNTHTFIDAANGVMDLPDTGTTANQSGGILEGFTPFSARYIKFELNTWTAAANSNVGWCRLIPYSQVVVDNATGTLIQSTNTVTGTRTEVGGTMLYADNEGTATLGTDLSIFFSCDGGSNWTEAAGYNAITPVYSSGVKQVRLDKTTCTGGTDVRYKAVFANQSDGSKETQLHGIGINY